jgi:peroxiredoxin
MLLLVSLATLGRAASTGGGALKVGDPAPDFTLVDQNGAKVRLYGFLGKKRVVLAFYIKAFTPT